ncbi:MAG: molybdopterin molybdotransferase MoeA [Verrucomicrobiae bacterium]|nr:molybdopterin molybdotransferase MoeA [Verrucomicrobiae bacterium]
MISLESAQESILGGLRPLATTEILPVAMATGRVPTGDLNARVELPPFDNASVDGYAVQSADLAGAGPENPVALEEVGRVSAGDLPSRLVTSGTCVRIFTGAIVPPGADAVVMQEDTSRGEGGLVRFMASVGPWEGVRLAGGDLKLGARVAEAGVPLSPARVGLLAATGHATVSVHRRPRITLLATGNELTSPGDPLVPGRIYDSNRALLSALAAKDGFHLVSAGLVQDTPEGTMAALVDAARASDVVVTTGGVSVGDSDLVKAAVMALGGTVENWRLALKPGKPFAWGRFESALWFGLPGNPVSAFVTWWLLVRPALRRLMGMKVAHGQRLRGRLGEAVGNEGERRHFMRVRLDEEGRVWIAGAQASHIQSGLAEANGLLDVPPRSVWEMGRDVEVLLLA